MKKNRTTAHTVIRQPRWREYVSIALFVFAVLLALALFTYKNVETGDTNAPSECTNAVGLIGLQASYWLFKIFGVSVYIFPLLLIVLAIMTFMRFTFPNLKNLALRSFALFGLLITGSCLADVFHKTPIAYLNISSAGGEAGRLINEYLLRKYFDEIGATVILIGVSLILFLFLFDTSLRNGWLLLRWIGMAFIWLILTISAAFIWLGRSIYALIIAALYKIKTKLTEWRAAKQYKRETVIVVTGDTKKTKRKKREPVAPPEPEIIPDKIIPDTPEDNIIKLKHEQMTTDDDILPPYELPSTDYFGDSDDEDISELENEAKIATNKLQETFKEFGVDAEVGNVICGPVITCHEVHPAPGVPVKKITGLEDEIAMAMKAQSIRIVAPIPGKDAVGIELPNKVRRIVTYSQLIHTDEYQSAVKDMILPLALGQMLNGDVFIDDLAKMPHLLVAGATGSGKSVCINTILMSLLLKFQPHELKLILVDPKHVELVPYHNLSHLLVPVLNSPEKIPEALEWLIEEMSLRYKYFARIGVRNIYMFNQKRENDKTPLEIKSGAVTHDVPDFLPYIVVVIDELADLMMMAKTEVEHKIIRLAQLARAAGIHMVIATQRPSTNVITGLIKANIPARIAFRTTSGVDSKVILDEPGSNKLLGMGDMLYKSPTTSMTMRIQGAFVSEEEVRHVTSFVREQRPTNYVDLDIAQAKQTSQEIYHDDKLDDAIRVVVSSGQASASYLQRSLRVGYARAASLIDIMEQKGIVGPKRGAKPREILIDDWDAEE